MIFIEQKWGPHIEQKWATLADSFGRVKNGTREKLIEYQRECFDVLANHFMPNANSGLSQLPEPPTKTAIAGCLTLEQQDVIKALVKERAEALPKDKQAGATIRCWSAIKKKFGCSYKEVSSDNFVNIISLLSRLPLEGELLEAEKPESQPSLTLDLDLPEGVKQLTLSLNSNPVLGGRWTLWHSGDMLMIKPLERDAFVSTSAKLAGLIEDSMGHAIHREHIPAIIAACAKRLDSAYRLA